MHISIQLLCTPVTSTSYLSNRNYKFNNTPTKKMILMAPKPLLELIVSKKGQLNPYHVVSILEANRLHGHTQAQYPDTAAPHIWTCERQTSNGTSSNDRAFVILGNHQTSCKLEISPGKKYVQSYSPQEEKNQLQRLPKIPATYMVGPGWQILSHR